MPNPAAIRLGLGQHASGGFKISPRRSLLRLRGRVCYWHKEDGKPGTWGVVKGDGLTKYHVHLSEFRNTNVAPDVRQTVEFTPRPPRATGELNRAVDVFVERKSQ